MSITEAVRPLRLSYWLPAHWYRPRYSKGWRVGFHRGLEVGRLQAMHAAIDEHRSQATQSERNAFQLGADAQRLGCLDRHN